MGSAGEHEWSEVVVHIYPTVTGARFAVITRKNRGTAKVWQRTLCVMEVVEADWDRMATLRGILEGAAEVLTRAAERAR